MSRDFKRLGRSRSKLHVKIDQEFFCLFAAERAEGENEKRREREERREERENKGLALRFVKGDWCVLARERESKSL